ncbi:sigma-70 family RNA polymerase sigma factor [Marinobacterium sp. D7]|uniref:RNA polymerase sigma factor n=1 Tax=Marinobacterium ramblicola TaxID=2849041 RepID=UPI001C2DD29A|nr:sigma-70 family RNA polymerase sigma factor [Marinobacterium ramblicola]MBV1789667.1 sigma-70 family RNA polymerase sigma factor [Marinobacterium ramblicola]
MDEDKALLDAIIARQESALESFYRKYSGLVYSFALRTLKNPVDASEVMNEVMLEVWNRASSFAYKSSIKTWLLSITHHKAVDMVRRNVRHDHEDETEIDPESADQLSCSIEQGEISSENSGHIRYCMDGLGMAQRQVIYLTFFEGCSYPEIAATLDIPEGTVKTRMMHAKKLLLACLGRLIPKWD